MGVTFEHHDALTKVDVRSYLGSSDPSLLGFVALALGSDHCEITVFLSGIARLEAQRDALALALEKINAVLDAAKESA